MKNAKVTIRPAEITSIQFNAPKVAKPGVPVKLKMACKFNAGINQNAPTNGAAKVQFIIETEDGDKVLEIETTTVVTASTYIDNFQQVIKKEYGQIILLDANEKVRTITQSIGMTVKFPGITLPYGEQDNGGSDDDTLDDILKNYGKI